jgi:hypothetical protein
MIARPMPEAHHQRSSREVVKIEWVAVYVLPGSQILQSDNLTFDRLEATGSRNELEPLAEQVRPVPALEVRGAVITDEPKQDVDTTSVP